MTPQEALIILDGFNLRNNADKYDNEALNIAQEALEKQMPKKPLDVCTPVITWGLCPVCKGELNKLGNSVNHVFKSNAFCPDCGQALDWSDEDA